MIKLGLFGIYWAHGFPNLVKMQNITINRIRGRICHTSELSGRFQLCICFFHCTFKSFKLFTLLFTICYNYNTNIKRINYHKPIPINNYLYYLLYSNYLSPLKSIIDWTIKERTIYSRLERYFSQKLPWQNVIP